MAHDLLPGDPSHPDHAEVPEWLDDYDPKEVDELAIKIALGRIYDLPEEAPALLYRCPSLPAGTRTLALETSWDLPNLGL